MTEILSQNKSHSPYYNLVNHKNDFETINVEKHCCCCFFSNITAQSDNLFFTMCLSSLREAIHDDNVQPKMQCLMMDSSFSMVTMQGEDSGIAWETTSSRCNTPWASESGNSAVDLSSPAVFGSAAPPGSVPAGKIIFVMDEEMISKRRAKERTKRSKAERQREMLLNSMENVSERPELVGVSQPNVKTEENDEEEPHDPLVDKDQRLFSLVSEGSEILNIVVPTKVATVDEEESKEMVDNLSYLEDVLLPKASEETDVHELEVSTTEPNTTRIQPIKPLPSHVMDPPGAPVVRPPGRAAAGNVDYFEAFNLIDVQAPGGPAVVAHEQEEDTEVTTNFQETQKLVLAKGKIDIMTPLDHDKSDTVSLDHITSDLLDEVFYSGTDSYVKNHSGEDGATEGAPARLPSKATGTPLFGSQEDILTPIFLPEGPPKIIDPILLEEPKAMAFLYTDLYEEAVGTRQKEEDVESVNSEKSFHSRNSDREARGYLEKYALIDETPVVEVEPTDKGEHAAEGQRVLSQDYYDFGAEKGVQLNSEEEITDFFRSSCNSSPCDIEPFARSHTEEEDQPTTTENKTEKHISITAPNVSEIQTLALDTPSFDFPLEEDDFGITDDYSRTVDEQHGLSDPKLRKDFEVQKPVAPPRKKPLAPKPCLDLTPLTPVDVIVVEAGGKEQQEEKEKETASPPENADKGDGKEIVQTSNLVPSVLASIEISQTDSEGPTTTDTNSASMEEKNTATQEPEADDPSRKMESGEADSELLDIRQFYPEKPDNSQTVSPTERAKDKGQCIIL